MADIQDFPNATPNTAPLAKGDAPASMPDASAPLHIPSAATFDRTPTPPSEDIPAMPTERPLKAPAPTPAAANPSVPTEEPKKSTEPVNPFSAFTAIKTGSSTPDSDLADIAARDKEKAFSGAGLGGAGAKPSPAASAGAAPINPLENYGADAVPADAYPPLPDDNFAVRFHLPPKILSVKFLSMIFIGIFVAGLFFGSTLLGTDSSASKGSDDFTIGYIVTNPEVPAGRPRCGSAEQSQGCVLYLQNNRTRELEAKDFYPLVMQLTGMQRFQLETGNMRYAHKYIKPGWIAQFNIPPTTK